MLSAFSWSRACNMRADRALTSVDFIPALIRGARKARMSWCDRRFQAPADMCTVLWSKPRTD